MDLGKETLVRLYLKEKRSAYDIAQMPGCSTNLIRIKCKKFGVPLRNPGTKKCAIDTSTLRRLYLKEKKCMYEIAKILNCSPSVISKGMNKAGIQKREGR